MSFLHPWFWLAAFGVAVPLWLHLRRKKPENLVAFSAVRFLDDLPRPKSGSLRVRDPWLLAARLLALLLVVAAFAWPYLREAAPVVTASRVHILDNTLSQQAADGFESDREAVMRALARSGPSEQDAVVALTGRPTVVVAFGDDRESAERALRELEPSHQRGSYLEAFRLAKTLLDQSLGLEKEIRFYGDSQQNQWSEHETSPPFLRDVEVVLAGLPAEPALANLALHEPRSRLFFLGEKTFVDLTVTATHQGPSEVAEVTIETGGETVLSRQLQLDGLQLHGPSNTMLRARWETDPTRWLRGVATIAGANDELAADDRAYFCIPPLREGRVALVARSPYLLAALDPEVMRGRWASERLDPSTADPEAPLAELADVLLIEASYVQSERIRHLVLRYLNNERGVVLVLDRMTPLIRGFLREIDFEATALPSVPAALPAAAAPRSQKFRYFNVYHPIFQPFVDGELGDLLATSVHRYVPLRSRSARPLIYGDAGGALMAEGMKTKGRLLVFPFGFDLDQTDWPIQPSFVPFLDLTLQYARAATALETSWRPGSLYPVELDGAGPVAQIVVYREESDGEEEVLRRDVEAGAEEVRFRVPDRPGIYRVGLDERREPHALLAVNPAPEESHLVYEAEPPALASWKLVTDEAPPHATAAGFSVMARSDILRQNLWWWLAFSALLALAFESLMLGRRREAP